MAKPKRSGRFEGPDSYADCHIVRPGDPEPESSLDKLERYVREAIRAGRLPADTKIPERPE